jgi:two-component sensor histidine kinase
MAIMERFLRFLPPRPGSYLIRYTLTAIIVVLCAALINQLHRDASTSGFFIFYFAVFLTSILFDHMSGFVATALSTAFLYFWLKTPGVAWPSDAAPLLGLFVLIAIGVAFVSEGLRKAWERAVEAEKIKDLLLQELHHRTKNNLAMVISVLALQARGNVSDETRTALQNAISRIRAIAGAHDQIGTLDGAGKVDLKDYITSLCSHFNDGMRGIRPVSVEVEVDSMSVPTNDAQSIGLIVNELVTNAMKHAFPNERSGTVKVTLRDAAPRLLLVEDNGVGTGESMAKGGIGSRLTGLLAKQLDGAIVWEDAAPGCRVRVTLGESAA